MLNALRSATKPQSLVVFSNPSHYIINICSKSSEIGFRTLLTEAGKQDEIKMDETKKPGTETKPKDTMSSFGEGYATRSDEEGFGGIYGGNQDVEEKIVHGNAPEYDTKQGSEVKEKEKGRNQPQAS